jgi:flavin reductase (DIM6/NTAB) family NADH-FMN oxidoreductase RutF
VVRALPLGKVYRLLEPGPVVLVSTARVGAPLVAECYANLECRLHDTSLARKYNFLVLRVVKAWIDPARKRPRTIHHLGSGQFMVAGRTLRLPSGMK